MRSIRSTGSVLALTLLALSSSRLVAQAPSGAPATTGMTVALSAPAPGAVTAAPASEWGGVYRLVLTRGAENVPLRLVVERAGSALEATMSTADATGALYNVRIEDGALRADVATPRGTAQLVLRDTGAGLEGTLVSGRRTWAVSGERSS
jgi:hypothetical protein